MKDLLIFLIFFKRELPIKVLGVGSNVLIRDGGFDGVIIKFGVQISPLSEIIDYYKSHGHIVVRRVNCSPDLFSDVNLKISEIIRIEYFGG